MNSTLVTVVGVVASRVTYSTTAGGVPVAQFRLASTERRYDRPRQIWIEGATSYFTIWAWRSLAENTLTSIGVGDPLLVTGRMRIREWDRPGQAKGVAAEIEAASLGHDLTRGTTVFRKTVRGRPELVASAGERARLAERAVARAAAERAAMAAAAAAAAAAVGGGSSGETGEETAETAAGAEVTAGAGA